MSEELLASVSAGETLANAEETAKIEETNGTEPVDSSVDDGENAGQKRRSIPGSQRAKMQALQATARANAAELQVEELQRQLGQRATIPGLGEPPKEADYPDYFDYQAAKTAHIAAETVMRAQAFSQSQARQQEAAQNQFERKVAFEELQAKAKQLIPEYDKVINESAKSGVSLTNELLGEIHSSDKAPLIAHHLSLPANWDLLREVNQLSGRALSREIGRLEGQLKWPSLKTSTAAPAPLSKVNGGASASFDPESGSHDQFKEMFARKK